jgi:SulP family sulfate permease
VYRLDDRLFFANAGYFKGRVKEAIRAARPRVQWVVLNFEAMVHIDATGVETLRELRAGLADEGIALACARVKSDVRTRLDATGLTATIGAANMHPTVRAAVTACAVTAEEPSVAPSGAS